MNKSPKEPKKATKAQDVSEKEELNARIKQLEYENRLLKIKTEYLEMLRSLGQEEIKQEQESSTNSEDDIY